MHMQILKQTLELDYQDSFLTSGLGNAGFEGPPVPRSPIHTYFAYYSSSRPRSSPIQRYVPPKDYITPTKV